MPLNYILVKYLTSIVSSCSLGRAILTLPFTPLGLFRFVALGLGVIPLRRFTVLLGRLLGVFLIICNVRNNQ
jgi:hypothetical protein